MNSKFDNLPKKLKNIKVKFQRGEGGAEENGGNGEGREIRRRRFQ